MQKTTAVAEPTASVYPMQEGFVDANFVDQPNLFIRTIDDFLHQK